MATVSARWWAGLPATYEPDSELVRAALSGRLHLVALPVPDRIYLVGALTVDPHEMSASAIADRLHCHMRTVRKYRRLWGLSGMSDEYRYRDVSSVLLDLHLPPMRGRRR